MIYSVSLQQQCKLKCTKKGKTRNTGKWSIEVYILNITFLIKKKKKKPPTQKNASSLFQVLFIVVRAAPMNSEL